MKKIIILVVALVVVSVSSIIIAKENKNMISLGTDAHSCYEVGRFDNVLCLLNEIDYPKDLIINCDNDKLLKLKNN